MTTAPAERRPDRRQLAIELDLAAYEALTLRAQQQGGRSLASVVREAVDLLLASASVD